MGVCSRLWLLRDPIAVTSTAKRSFGPTLRLDILYDVIYYLDMYMIYKEE